MVQAEGGRTEPTWGTLARWLGVWQVRGPREGVGHEAGEDTGTRDHGRICKD